MLAEYEPRFSNSLANDNGKKIKNIVEISMQIASIMPSVTNTAFVTSCFTLTTPIRFVYLIIAKFFKKINILANFS